MSRLSDILYHVQTARRHAAQASSLLYCAGGEDHAAGLLEAAVAVLRKAETDVEFMDMAEDRVLAERETAA